MCIIRAYNTRWARVVGSTRAPRLPKPYPCIVFVFLLGFVKIVISSAPRPNNTTNPLENYVTRRCGKEYDDGDDHVQPITLFFGNVSHRLQKTFRTMCSRKCVLVL